MLTAKRFRAEALLYSLDRSDFVKECRLGDTGGVWRWLWTEQPLMRLLKRKQGRDAADGGVFPTRLNSIVDRGRDNFAERTATESPTGVEPVTRRFWTPDEVPESNGE